MSERKITLESYYNRWPLEMTADGRFEHPARRAYVEMLKQLGFGPRLVNGLRAPWEYVARFDSIDRFNQAEKIAILAGEFFFGDYFQHVFQA